jgi:hypothetical protein
LKKINAILFLLLYINAAFGTNTDCYGCWGKLVNVKLQVPAKPGCKDSFSQKGMGCCDKEAISCNTNNPNFQIQTIAAGLSFNEYTGNNAVAVKVDLFSIGVKQFHDHYLTRTAPPRDILSFIHVLRI